MVTVDSIMEPISLGLAIMIEYITDVLF